MSLQSLLSLLLLVSITLDCPNHHPHCNCTNITYRLQNCTHQREDWYAELEVGAGATLGQMAEKAQRSGWQVKMEKMKNVENINHSSSTIITILPGIICTSDTRGDRGRRRGFSQSWSWKKQVDKLSNMLGRQRQRQKEDNVYPG